MQGTERKTITRIEGVLVDSSTQTAQILAHLVQGRSITPIEALKIFGCLRLSARIYDLKKAGYKIKSRMQKNGKKQYKIYWI